MKDLSTVEAERYSRQILLDGWGIDGQKKLKNKTVFVPGCGGMGSAVINYLLLAGVGEIRTCDFDVVELSNLNRQFLHDDSRLGIKKAVSAAISSHRINPNVNMVSIPERVSFDNDDRLAGDCDYIINCVDLLPALVVIDYAVRKKVPFIAFGMMDINVYIAKFIDYTQSCYGCLFDLSKKSVRAMISNYDKMFSLRPVAPAPVVGAMCGFIANLAVIECLQYLLGNDNSKGSNTIRYFNFKNDQQLSEDSAYSRVDVRRLLKRKFIEQSKEQNFDWDNPWSSPFYSNIVINGNPDCYYCSKQVY
jgi:adenylyltransferase/sulfurtransferase